MEGLARDLPPGMKVKAYDQSYVWQQGAYDFLWAHDLEYRWGLLGQWFGERPKVKFNLGDQKDALVTFEGTNDGLDSAPAAFMGLLKGANFGKQLVRVGPDKA